MKKLLAALVLLGLIIAATVVGIEAGWKRGLSELSARGVTWERTEAGYPIRRIFGVSRGPVRVQELGWSMTNPKEVYLWGVEVDVSALSGSGDGGDGGAGGDPGSALDAIPPWLRVEAADVSIRRGEEVLAEGLSGYFQAGEAELSGDGFSATAPGPEGALVEVSIRRSSPLEEIKGDLDVTVIWGGASPQIRVDAPKLVVRHPLLSKRKLPIEGLFLELDGDPRDAPVTGRAGVTGVEAQVTLHCPDGTCTVDVVLPDSPAALVLAPLTPIAPEIGRADIGGTIGFDATYAWPSGEWDIVPRVRELTVSGAVNNIAALRQGRFEYRVRTADGDTRIRSTGEGTRNWTSFQEVTPHLPAAVIAAEDSAFKRHRGYSEEGIRQAILANKDAGGVVRGGSTMTQQLAKNLFLDGERTLERKLRELILAVELDASLGKMRVLELYINIVEWGPDIYGIREASDAYFMRPPGRLPAHEAAFLGAILPDPRGFYYRWYLRDRAGSFKIDWVLKNMADGGYFSHDEARAQMQKSLNFVPPPKQK